MYETENNEKKKNDVKQREEKKSRFTHIKMEKEKYIGGIQKARVTVTLNIKFSLRF